MAKRNSPNMTEGEVEKLSLDQINRMIADNLSTWRGGGRSAARSPFCKQLIWLEQRERIHDIPAPARRFQKT